MSVILEGTRIMFSSVDIKPPTAASLEEEFDTVTVSRA